MEYEAAGGFVAMDIELQAPLFRLGFLGGTEYADLPDSPPKHYRNALSMVKRAVQFFTSGEVAAVAHLGDVLAAENAANGTTQSALESFHHALGTTRASLWHFAGGLCDVRTFGAGGHGAALSPARSASRTSYYSFFPADRIILLSSRGLVGGNALPDADAVLERIAAYPGTVVAVLSLGEPPLLSSPLLSTPCHPCELDPL